MDPALVNNSNHQKDWSYLSKHLLFQGSCDYIISCFSWSFLSFSFIQKLPYVFIYLGVTSFFPTQKLRASILCLSVLKNHLSLFLLKDSLPQTRMFSSKPSETWWDTLPPTHCSCYKSQLSWANASFTPAWLSGESLITQESYPFSRQGQRLQPTAM